MEAMREKEEGKRVQPASSLWAKRKKCLHKTMRRRYHEEMCVLAGELVLRGPACSLTDRGDTACLLAATATGNCGKHRVCVYV